MNLHCSQYSGLKKYISLSVSAILQLHDKKFLLIFTKHAMQMEVGILMYNVPGNAMCRAQTALSPFSNSYLGNFKPQLVLNPVGHTCCPSQNLLRSSEARYPAAWSLYKSSNLGGYPPHFFYIGEINLQWIRGGVKNLSHRKHFLKTKLAPKQWFNFWRKIHKSLPGSSKYPIRPQIMK